MQVKSHICHAGKTNKQTNKNLQQQNVFDIKQKKKKIISW